MVLLQYLLLCTICFRKIFYSQTFPVIQQNSAREKSSHSTILMNAFGGLKIFSVVVEAPISPGKLYL